MSLSALRTPLRASVRRAAQPSRLQLRSTFNRKFSTPPPPAPEAKTSNTGLYIGLGAAAVGGLGYYFYSINKDDTVNAIKSGKQIAKVKTNFVPSKEDYIKVGAFFSPVLSPSYRIVSRSTTESPRLSTMPANTTVNSHR